MLNSLMLQSVMPEKIYLWLPKKYIRFPEGEIEEVPDFIKKNPMIYVNYSEEDYGPATKLLPYLQQYSSQKKPIIVVDDDRIYHEDFIKNLLHYSALSPDSAIGVGGVVVKGLTHNQYNTTKQIRNVDVLLGSQGYLVKPLFFSHNVFHYPKHLPEAFYEDDVWFSGHLQTSGISRMIVPATPSIQCRHHKKKFALCLNENKDKHNFMRVFNYFNF